MDLLTAWAVLEIGQDAMIAGFAVSGIDELINTKLQEAHKLDVRSFGRACKRLGVTSRRSENKRLWRASAETMARLADFTGKDQKIPSKPIADILPGMFFVTQHHGLRFSRNGKTYKSITITMKIGAVFPLTGLL